MSSGTIKNKILTNCKFCKKTFIKLNGRSVYCSKECKNKSLYQRRKFYVLAWQREKIGKYKKGKAQCEICGKWYIRVASHAFNTHEMSKREYKQYIGADVKKGYIPSWFRKLLRKKNLENKEVVWENLKAGKKFWFRKGISNNYQRSDETLERLKTQFLNTPVGKKYLKINI